jgi:hypothetical protein
MISALHSFAAIGKSDMGFPVTLILLFLIFFVSPACAGNPALNSRGLEQRIDFWKKVYVQYGADDIIIHDRIYVNLIYDVATEATLDAKITEIENALQEIRSNLNKPCALTPRAASISKSIAAQGLSLSADLIDGLLSNIHQQAGIKERFRDGIIRSGRYVEKFREIMAKHGIPTELALLPLIESSFQNARSKAGALGVWQFVSGTGKSYLRINRKVDERLDAVRSTEAAAHLLKDNYRALGTWPLAITAYNHGCNGMLRAQKLHGSDLPVIISEHSSPLFGYASMNYYCEFLAAVEVYEKYPQYFGKLTLDSPDSPAEKPTQLKALPPSTRKAYVPSKRTAVAAARYKVRNGDTLSNIAQRVGVPISHLMAKNKLKKPLIQSGQVLLIR